MMAEFQLIGCPACAKPMQIQRESEEVTLNCPACGAQFIRESAREVEGETVVAAMPAGAPDWVPTGISYESPQTRADADLNSPDRVQAGKMCFYIALVIAIAGGGGAILHTFGLYSIFGESAPRRGSRVNSTIIAGGLFRFFVNVGFAFFFWVLKERIANGGVVSVWVAAIVSILLSLVHIGLMIPLVYFGVTTDRDALLIAGALMLLLLMYGKLAWHAMRVLLFRGKR
jgi:hypothetical protein